MFKKVEEKRKRKINAFSNIFCCSSSFHFWRSYWHDFCVAPAVQHEVPYEFMSTACDFKEEERILTDCFERAIRLAIIDDERHTPKWRNQVNVTAADWQNINRIIEQAKAKNISLFSGPVVKTYFHQLCLDLSALEFHRLAHIMMMLKQANIFGIRDIAHRDTALHLAIMNDIDLLPGIMDLFAKNCKYVLQLQNKFGDNLLHLAAKQTSLSKLERIAQYYKGHLNVKNAEGNTALHNAASIGNSEILQYLSSLEGIDVNAQNNENQTPLHFLFSAPVDNFIKNLNILVNAGADIDAVDWHGKNMLFYAIYNEWSLEIAQEIVKLGCNWRTKDNRGRSILHICVTIRDSNLINYFARLGADVNEIYDSFGRTVVHRAAQKGDPNVFECLILNGGDINIKDKRGDTPLSLIINLDLMDPLTVIRVLIEHGVKLDGNNNNIEKLLKLIEKKMTNAEKEKIIDLVVDLSCVNKYGQSLLHSVATLANVELAEYLISKGADVNKKDVQGRTPLHVCVASKSDKYFSLVDALLSHGADINATDKFGFNVLLLAAKSGKGLRDLERLTTLGANWHVTNYAGQSIVHVLTKEGNVKALKHFLSLGANVNAVNKLNETPLHSAKNTRQNFVETVTVLVENGVQLNALNLWGFTALQAAILARRSPDELSFIREFFENVE